MSVKAAACPQCGSWNDFQISKSGRNYWKCHGCDVMGFKVDEEGKGVIWKPKTTAVPPPKPIPQQQRTPTVAGGYRNYPASPPQNQEADESLVLSDREPEAKKQKVSASTDSSSTSIEAIHNVYKDIIMNMTLKEQQFHTQVKDLLEKLDKKIDVILSEFGKPLMIIKE